MKALFKEIFSAALIILVIIIFFVGAGTTAKYLSPAFCPAPVTNTKYI